MTQRSRRSTPRLQLPDWSTWDEAGVRTLRGRVDRPASGRRYPTPFKVELSGSKLEYWWEDPNVIGWVGKPRWPRQAGTQLDLFIGLGSAPDARILAFARRYGVLRLCPHWRPWMHSLGSA